MRPVAPPGRRSTGPTDANIGLSVSGFGAPKPVLSPMTPTPPAQPKPPEQPPAAAPPAPAPASPPAKPRKQIRVVYEAEKNEVHVLGIDAQMMDAQAPDWKTDTIDVNEVLGPIFSDLLHAGKIEEETLNGLQAVKEALDEEVDVLRKKLKDSSFRRNIFKLAAKADEEKRARHEAEMARLREAAAATEAELKKAREEAASLELARGTAAIAQARLRELEERFRNEAAALAAASDRQSRRQRPPPSQPQPTSDGLAANGVGSPSAAGSAAPASLPSLPHVNSRLNAVVSHNHDGPTTPTNGKAGVPLSLDSGLGSGPAAPSALAPSAFSAAASSLDAPPRRKLSTSPNPPRGDSSRSPRRKTDKAQSFSAMRPQPQPQGRRLKRNSISAGPTDPPPPPGDGAPSEDRLDALLLLYASGGGDGGGGGGGGGGANGAGQAMMGGRSLIATASSAMRTVPE
eukprot:tig00020825_g14290.t1